MKLQPRDMPLLGSKSIGQTDRFHCLDAMRGIAAISVVMLHVSPFSGGNLAPGGDLAVDFFFALSGFVIARAYKERLLFGLSVAQFCEIRIVRLYPLFIVGIGLGILKEIGKIASHQPGAPSWGVLFKMILSNSFILPTPGEQFLFPLNTPDWSLFLELVINFLYAMVLVKLSLRWLVAVCFISACTLAYGAITVGNISLGPDWATLPYGLARIGYSFSLGVIFAGFWSEAMRRTTYFAIVPIVAFALLLTMSMPANIRVLFNPVMATLVFPAILWTGSVWEVPRIFRRTCALLGDISYPLYAIHFPLLVVFARVQQQYLHFQMVPLTWVLLIVFMLLISALLVSLYDAPLRAYVSAALKIRRSAPSQIV